MDALERTGSHLKEARRGHAAGGRPEMKKAACRQQAAPFFPPDLGQRQRVIRLAQQKVATTFRAATHRGRRPSFGWRI